VGSAPRDARADAKVLNGHGDLSISVNMNDASDRWATFHQARDQHPLLVRLGHGYGRYRPGSMFAPCSAAHNAMA
jgi:hypothetical protein